MQGSLVVPTTLLSGQVFLEVAKGRSGFHIAIILVLVVALLQAAVSPIGLAKQRLLEKLSLSLELYIDQVIIDRSLKVRYEALFTDYQKLGMTFHEYEKSLFRSMSGFSGILSGSIQVILGSVIILSFQPILMISFIVALVPLITSNKQLNQLQSDKFHATLPEMQTQSYLRAPFSNPSVAEDVRTYPMSDLLLGKIAKSKDRQKEILSRQFKAESKVILLSVSFEVIAVAVAVFVVLKVLDLQNYVTLAASVTAIYAVLQSLGGLENIGRGLAAFTYGSGIIKNGETEFHNLMNDVTAQHDIACTELASPQRKESQPGESATRVQQNSFKDEAALPIKVSAVGFEYRAGPAWSLKGVSVEFPRTGLCALVGENGAGKSTLLRLIGAVACPSDGYVQLFGDCITESNRHQIASKVAGLYQGSCFLPLTFREVVQSGDISRDLTDKYLNHLLARVGLLDQVDRLPNGADTPLSPMLFGGVSLSFGQDRKLKIARMLWKNSPIMLLDEPTLGLDAPTATNLITILNEEVKSAQRLIIVATHDKRVVENAHTVAVLRNGNLVANGLLHEVMSENPILKAMFADSQSQNRNHQNSYGI